MTTCDSSLKTVWRCCDARQMIAVLAAVLLVTFLAASVHAQAKSPLAEPAFRLYSQGVLAPEDFKATPDGTKDQGMAALTMADIRYDIRFQISKKEGKLVGRVETVSVFAVLLREESWNKAPQDKALLDHEQGHFDLTQIFALRAQAELTRRIEDSPLEATALKEAEVRQTLDREVRKLLRPFVDLSKAANSDYDRATRHGTLPEPQAQARREQRALLKKLTAATP